MKVFIAGRTGQVAKALLEQAQLRNLVSASFGRPELDITRKNTISKCLAEADWDVVVNAAAYTNVDGAEDEEAAATEVNGQGARDLAAAARDHGIPFIHLSTDYVFSGDKDEPYVEDDPLSPLSAYGRSKLAGEKAVAAVGGRYAIIRTAWVYSPFGNNFVKTMLRLAAERDEISVVADQMGCPTSAHDIADGVLKIAQSFVEPDSTNPNGAYHLAGAGDASWADLAEEVFSISAELGGPSAIVRRIPTSAFPTKATRPMNSRLDCSKIERVFDVAPQPWRKSLEKCVGRLLNGVES